GLFWSGQRSVAAAYLFLDTCRLAGALAQEVQLGATYVTATLDLDAVDQRAVRLEYTLNANTVGNLAHGKGRVQAAVALGNHHTLERLDTLAITFLHLHVDGNGVARAEFRYVGFQLCVFNVLNQGFLAAHDCLLLLLKP